MFKFSNLWSRDVVFAKKGGNRIPPITTKLSSKIKQSTKHFQNIQKNIFKPPHNNNASMKIDVTEAVKKLAVELQFLCFFKKKKKKTFSFFLQITDTAKEKHGVIVSFFFFKRNTTGVLITPDGVSVPASLRGVLH